MSDEPVRSRSYALTPLLVAAAALLLTASATGLAWTSARNRDGARFENAVQSATDRITARMEIYIALLRGAGGMLAAGEISRADWRRYAGRLDVRVHYPGIQGIGYTRRVEPDSIDALVRRMRAQGAEGFRVWPDSARAEYHSILYLEPLDRRNQAALGYDMFTDPVRHEAMQRARDTGLAALSGRVTLVQEIEGPVQAGFLVYVPVYRGGEIPATMAARRVDLQGFAYAPFRAGDLFAGIFGTEKDPRVAFRVYDGRGTDAEHLLYDSRAEPDEPWPRSRLTTRGTVEIAGRTWTLVFVPTPAFGTGSRGALVPMVALSGLLVSVVLFGLSRSQAVAQREAERNARDTAELAAQRQEHARELRAQMEEAHELNQELAAANRALDTARAEAEEANRAKGQFLANMSHELRTPLNAIGGYADLLEMEIRGPITDAQRIDLERIRYAQQHLLGLINDVLNFAKLEAGRVTFRMEPVSVEAALQQVETLIAPLAQRRQVAYRRLGADAGVQVCADPDKLQQILVNLLSNAVKFTDAGGEVCTGWELRDDHVDLFVRDTGRGMPAARLDSIFEPFVQVDADLTRTSQGTGLGLAISHELACAMDGDLTVESEEGVGSTFTLRLRPADAAEGSRREAAPVDEGRVPASWSARLERERRDGAATILLVEDNTDNRTIYRTILQHFDYRVLEARDGETGIRLAREHQPDLILMDISIPVIDGWEATKILKADERTSAIPIVALTAHALAADRATAERVGCDGYLAKPVEPRRVVEEVQRLVGGAAAEVRGEGRLLSGQTPRPSRGP
jgi:signal transduction histidine kinase/ActR/RegA family two-component response regulator